jgi:hypothetical protein
MINKFLPTLIVFSLLLVCYSLFAYFTKEGIQELLFVIVSLLSFVAIISFTLLPKDLSSKLQYLFYLTAFLLILTSVISANNPLFIFNYWKGIIVLSLIHFLGIIFVKFVLRKGKFWKLILFFNSLFFLGMLIGILFNIHEANYFSTIGGLFLAGSFCVQLNLLHKIKVNFKL